MMGASALEETVGHGCELEAHSGGRSEDWGGMQKLGCWEEQMVPRDQKRIQRKESFCCWRGTQHPRKRRQSRAGSVVRWGGGQREGLQHVWDQQRVVEGQRQRQGQEVHRELLGVGGMEKSSGGVPSEDNYSHTDCGQHDDTREQTSTSQSKNINVRNSINTSLRTRDHSNLPGQRTGSKGACTRTQGAPALAGGLHQCQPWVWGFGCCDWLRGGG